MRRFHTLGVVTDWIEVRGPETLAALVSTIEPGTSTPVIVDTFVALVPVDGVRVLAQFDVVDAETWPYMVTVEPVPGGSEADARRQTLMIIDRLRPAGWDFRATADDDCVLGYSSPGYVPPLGSSAD